MARHRKHNNQSPSPSSKWNKFLQKIDSAWGRFSVITAIATASFFCGTYYQGAKEAHIHMEYDRQREAYWREEYHKWLSEKDELNGLIYSLREQNLKLMSQKLDSLSNL